jgi:hypothetical protein
MGGSMGKIRGRFCGTRRFNCVNILLCSFFIGGHKGPSLCQVLKEVILKRISIRINKIISRF